MLIKVIEDYELYTFDRGEYPTWYSGRPAPARRPAEAQRSYDRPMRPSYISYGLLYVLADQNDTYERIAELQALSPTAIVVVAKSEEALIAARLEELGVVIIALLRRRVATEAVIGVVISSVGTLT